MFNVGDVVSWNDMYYRPHRGTVVGEHPEMRNAATTPEMWYAIENEQGELEFRPTSMLTLVTETTRTTHRFEIGTVVRGKQSGEIGIVTVHRPYPKYTIFRLKTNSEVNVSEDQITAMFSGSIVTLTKLLNDFEFAIRNDKDVTQAKAAITKALFGFEVPIEANATTPIS